MIVVAIVILSVATVVNGIAIILLHLAIKRLARGSLDDEL